jgi:hypothetical protein
VLGTKRLIIAGITGDDAGEAIPGSTVKNVKSAAEAEKYLKSLGKEGLKGYDRIVLVGESTGKNIFFGHKLSFLAGASGETASSSLFTTLKTMMPDQAALVLVACNTGNGLGPALGGLGFSVYAPIEKVGFISTMDNKVIPGIYDGEAGSRSAIFHKYP